MKYPARNNLRKKKNQNTQRSASVAYERLHVTSYVVNQFLHRRDERKGQKTTFEEILATIFQT